MEYRVEELAGAAGVKVDTVRFYQGRGLIEPPRREGRVAFYGDDHLERLRRIRTLLADGFSLAQIGRLLDSEPLGDTGDGGPAPAAARDDGLLRALVAETVGDRTLSRSELAAEAGVPEALITATVSSGLIEPLVVDGEERFTHADAEMARAGLEILGRGFPLPALLELAVGHAQAMESTADAAIELFDANVIEPARAAEDAGEADEAEVIAEAFRDLLPQVARLVALHFQRTLVRRALERLRNRGDDAALERALSETKSAHLEVSWRR